MVDLGNHVADRDSFGISLSFDKEVKRSVYLVDCSIAIVCAFELIALTF